MKLIDLLVQELPKRGGWPKGGKLCVQSRVDKELYFSGECPFRSGVYLEITAEDEPTAEVTREQYEAALATSQQPAWNGEGLPPVGAECEAYKHSRDRDVVWVKVKIMYLSEFTVVMRELEKGASGEVIHHPRTLEFRPTRTEAERKRESAVKKISEIGFYLYDEDLTSAGVLYDAIAAGKIPGVKLEE